MPPLIDGEVELTNLSRKESSAFFSGTACELLVKTYFLEKGINVSEPHIDDGVDLLIQKPGEGWVRGQVKKVIYKSKLDYGMKSHSGKEVYRSQYDFRFQGSAGKGGKLLYYNTTRVVTPWYVSGNMGHNLREFVKLTSS